MTDEDKRNNRKFYIRCPPALMRQVDQLARARGVDPKNARSALIVEALRSYLPAALSLVTSAPGPQAPDLPAPPARKAM